LSSCQIFKKQYFQHLSYYLQICAEKAAVKGRRPLPFLRPKKPGEETQAYGIWKFIFWRKSQR